MKNAIWTALLFVLLMPEAHAADCDAPASPLQDTVNHVSVAAAGLEIEPKFVLESLPDIVATATKIKETEQYYLYIDGGAVRFRKQTQAGQDPHYYLTIKDDGDLVRKEFEREIPAWVYEQSIQHAVSRISKTRYVVPFTGPNGEELKYEIDDYHGANQGLITVEAEFPTVAVYEQWKTQLPAWLSNGQDVSDKAEFKNRKLAEPVTAQAIVTTTGNTAGGVELEVKLLLKGLPAQVVANGIPKRTDQFYLYNEGGEMRFRTQTGPDGVAHQYLTIKDGGGLARGEWEVALAPEDAWLVAQSEPHATASISKTRYVVKIPAAEGPNGHAVKYEVDEYHSNVNGSLKGLFTFEVELVDQADLVAWRANKPDYLADAPDISDDAAYKNRNLSKLQLTPAQHKQLEQTHELPGPASVTLN